HQRLFEVICTLREGGRPVDLVMLHDALHGRGWLAGVGGYLYLQDLWESLPSAANVVYYARIVRDKAMLRGLILAANEMLRRAYHGDGSVRDQLADAERAVYALSHLGSEGRVRTASEILKEVMSRIEQRQLRGRPDGLPSGMGTLDNLIAGWQPGTLSYLAARPSVGKTAVAGWMARYLVGYGASVLFVSLEQSDVDILERLLSGESGVSLHQLRHGRLNAADAEAILAARDSLALAPLLIDDRPGQTVGRIAANAR